MDIATIYAARSMQRAPLSDSILSIISKLKISFKPPFRRPQHKRREPTDDNWRQSAVADATRKIRERDDPDYDEINAMINKLTKQTYTKLIQEILVRLAKRDDIFRVRVTTLLFDRGVRQNFYASIMADAYADIAKLQPDALQDLETQVAMFDTLYDASKIVIVPMSSDPGYNEAILAWTKQKETKRSFAAYVAELYARKLVPEETMAAIVKNVVDELRENVTAPKTTPKEEHVDALVRCLSALAAKVAEVKPAIREILGIPRDQTVCMSMKSRFKLEDALK